MRETTCTVFVPPVGTTTGGAVICFVETTGGITGVLEMAGDATGVSLGWGMVCVAGSDLCRTAGDALGRLGDGECGSAWGGVDRAAGKRGGAVKTIVGVVFAFGKIGAVRAALAVSVRAGAGGLDVFTAGGVIGRVTNRGGGGAIVMFGAGDEKLRVRPGGSGAGVLGRAFRNASACFSVGSSEQAFCKAALASAV